MTAKCMLLCSVLIWGQSDETALRAQALQALQKSARFMTDNVATHGGYLWRYSKDLRARQGEVEASASTIWVQPPGTPSVGQAFLKAYEVTGEQQFLDAALAAADALMRGQLLSGGWDYRVEFDPKERQRYAYRIQGNPKASRNVTTLDDNTTQSALRFLMNVDRVTEFKNRQIHEAVRYALESLMKAQYPNGGWPQRFSAPPDPEKFPVIKASYPAEWSRTYTKVNYQDYYTFNDNAIADTIDTMIAAADIYGESRYRESAIRAGDFILLAQMPQPQPAWAQQYNAKMQPDWARRFEPPAITGSESQGIMRTLIQLYHETGHERFLNAVEPALDYLKKSRLPEGGLARFYELKTNKPLYFTREYELVYRDDDLPDHYGFKTADRLDRIADELTKARKSGPRKPDRTKGRPKPPNRALIANAEKVLQAMDEQGRWIETGTIRGQEGRVELIDCQTFVKNFSILCDLLASAAVSER